MTTDQVPPASGSQLGDTNPRRWERLAPGGALVFLLTIILGALAVGESSPHSDGPARDIAAYFADNQGGHLANTFLVVLGTSVFYPWFLASLCRALSRAEGDNGICATAALVGGVTLLGPILASAGRSRSPQKNRSSLRPREHGIPPLPPPGRGHGRGLFGLWLAVVAVVLNRHGSRG